MAIYHFSAKMISRSHGRSATAAAAYRGGVEITDERTGERHDYTRKQGVLDHAILTPNRAPEWARDSARLWNAVEEFENRKDAQLVREITVALPHELSLEQCRELLHGYVQAAFVKRGMAAQIDIHAPDREGDKRNIHAHIMLTTRQVTRNGFKAKKARNWNEKKTLVAWREQWADHVNKALERANCKERVDHRSFKDLGIVDREPTKHLGTAVTQMERRGEKTIIGDEYRAVQEFNKLQEQAKVVDLKIAREQRALAAQKMAQEYRKAAGKTDRIKPQRESGQEQRQQSAPAMQAQYKRAAGQKERVGKADIRAEQGGANDNRMSMEEAQLLREAQRLRHLDQTRDLESRQDREREKYRQELKAYYGPDDRKARRELKAIQERQQQKEGWRGFYYRMSGKGEADRIRAGEIRKGLKDSQQKQDWQMQGKERQWAYDRAMLADRQAEDRRKLEREIRKAMEPERTAQREAEKEREQDYGRGRGRSRERDFGFER